MSPKVETKKRKEKKKKNRKKETWKTKVHKREDIYFSFDKLRTLAEGCKSSQFHHVLGYCSVMRVTGSHIRLQDDGWLHLRCAEML